MRGPALEVVAFAAPPRAAENPSRFFSPGRKAKHGDALHRPAASLSTSSSASLSRRSESMAPSARKRRRLSPRADSTSSSSTSTNPDALFDVPAGLLSLYESVGSQGSLTCPSGAAVDDRSGGYKTNGKGKDGTRYCADAQDSPSFVYWESNMDVDCDGAPSTDGICEGDGSYFELTAFTDDAGKPINALEVPYVVINQGDGFDATKFGVQPLSVVAVICGKGGQITFGIWADTNALGSMGEASVNLARICFGSGINGNAGHDEADVLYVAFAGSKADTVPDGLGSDVDTIYTLGHKLVSGVFGGDGASPSSESTDSRFANALSSGAWPVD
ncbi:hypothetical protein JCM10212_000607 [Sporobolomyces blumeae]